MWSSIKMPNQCNVTLSMRHTKPFSTENLGYALHYIFRYYCFSSHPFHSVSEHFIFGWFNFVWFCKRTHAHTHTLTLVLFGILRLTLTTIEYHYSLQTEKHHIKVEAIIINKIEERKKASKKEKIGKKTEMMTGKWRLTRKVLYNIDILVHIWLQQLNGWPHSLHAYTSTIDEYSKTRNFLISCHKSINQFLRSPWMDDKWLKRWPSYFLFSTTATTDRRRKKKTFSGFC